MGFVLWSREGRLWSPSGGKGPMWFHQCCKVTDFLISLPRGETKGEKRGEA